VSAITASTPRARAAPSASKTTAPGVAPGLSDDRHAVALAPDDQLLSGCRAPRVAGGKEHALALPLQPFGELADRGGLAGAVHAGDHDDEWLRRGNVEGPLERLQQIEQRLLERALERRAVLELLLAQRGEHGLRGGHAAVGLQQRRLERLVGGFIDAPPREQLRDGRVEHLPRAREACLQARCPGKRCYHGSLAF
jgi:hypothetical protein